jgi:hypothetical protein
VLRACACALPTPKPMAKPFVRFMNIALIPG